MKSNGRGKRQERFIQEYLVDLNGVASAFVEGLGLGDGAGGGHASNEDKTALPEFLVD